MAPEELVCISGWGDPSTDTSGGMTPALAISSWLFTLSSASRQMASAAKLHTVSAEVSLELAEEQVDLP